MNYFPLPPVNPSSVIRRTVVFASSCLRGKRRRRPFSQEANSPDRWYRDRSRLSGSVMENLLLGDLCVLCGSNRWGIVAKTRHRPFVALSLHHGSANFPG